MKLLIIGAGGHGKVVADGAIAQGYEVVGFVDDNPRGDVMGLPVCGDIEELIARTIPPVDPYTIENDGGEDIADLIKTEIAHMKDGPRREEVDLGSFAPQVDLSGIDGFIVAIGDNEARKAKFEQYLDRGMQPLDVIHPSAEIADTAKFVGWDMAEILYDESSGEDPDFGDIVGAGIFVGAFASIGPDAVIDANTIINTRATVEHDCTVGAHSFASPHAVMLGESKLGEGALLGASATVGVGRTVGDWATIGEGAVVKTDIPDGSVAVGVPAKVRIA